MTALTFAVLHHINDPAGWAEVLTTEHTWPAGLDLRSFVEADDRRLAICVWRSPSRDLLQQSLDAAFGHVALNELHRVRIHRMEETAQG